MKPQAPSIRSVTLDDASIIRRTAEVEHERRIAITDLVHHNQVALHGEGAALATPYDLFLSARENRLTLRFTGSDGKIHEIALPLHSFRGTIKDYFLMCENYYEAIKHAPADRIQTLDMARRSVHNEGSELLQSLLDEQLTMDFATARRLFTLICVLHIK
jgi:uncharacterized protein (UPF0262 family)